MGNQWLAVSDPPHGDVDPRLAARCLGIAPAEAGMKVNFRAPEVWLAGSDKEQMDQAVGTMADAEMRVVLLAGDQLVNVPPQRAVATFAFGENELVARVDESDISIDYATPVTGVLCQPPADWGGGHRKSASLADSMGRGSSSVMLSSLAGSSSSLPEALEESTFLDLYVTRGDTAERISVAQDLVDFTGLGDAMQPRAKANMARFVSECEGRFSQLRLDTRLVNVRPRRRIMVGGPDVGHENRSPLSFGTQALSALLESISPEVRDLTQSELGSRLAFLMMA